MRRVAITAGMLALVLAGCGGDGGGGAPAAPEKTAAAAPKGAAVEIKAFQFKPDPIEVEAGQEVTWTNLDSTKHTVTGDGFDETLDQNGKFTFKFAKAGTYKYLCTLHSGPGMKGEVVVR